METTFAAFVLSVAVVGQSGSIDKDEIDYQKQAFQQWWGSELMVQFDKLPTEGKVADFRVPYSGHDYPDKGGGTVRALAKYDQAFHRGQSIATDFERQDVGQSQDRRGNWRGGPVNVSGGPAPRIRGLFARIRAGRERTPSWYGHCNGWTAAAIRHAEPEHNVERNGVVFTPADIKGLLAEVYMYQDTEFLGGVDNVINPATLHLTFTNWLGRGAYPIGMEVTPGEVVFNYPAYSYKSTVTKHSDKEVEVRTNVLYAKSTNYEMDKSPRINEAMSFHYVLDLNDNGEIVGGRYYNDSSRIDMLWSPYQPVQGGKEGNERGNPHIDVKEVLAIWRESVSEDIRKKWLTIDPTEEDRVLDDEEVASAENAQDE